MISGDKNEMSYRWFPVVFLADNLLTSILFRAGIRQQWPKVDLNLRLSGDKAQNTYAYRYVTAFRRTNPRLFLQIEQTIKSRLARSYRPSIKGPACLNRSGLVKT